MAGAAGLNCNADTKNDALPLGHAPIKPEHKAARPVPQEEAARQRAAFARRHIDRYCRAHKRIESTHRMTRSEDSKNVRKPWHLSRAARHIDAYHDAIALLAASLTNCWS